MAKKLTPTQLSTLAWVAREEADGEAPNSLRTSARSLARVDLVTVVGRGPRWRATVTDAGRHYLEFGDYPPGHTRATVVPVPAEPDRSPPQVPRPKRAAKPKVDDWDVDSPKGMRSRGKHPRGDALFDGGMPDPYDEKILVSVKEAAWMLSLTENAIRDAVLRWDIDRVYIGEGTRNYRVVYGSLLAWVNDMPRESAHHSWYR